MPGTRFQELKLSIMELENPDQVPKIVVYFFNIARSAKTDERLATFEGLAFLLREGVIAAPVILSGYVAGRASGSAAGRRAVV